MDVTEHLENLIRIPSVSRLSNRPVIDYAARALHEARWQTRRMSYNDAAGIEKVNLIAAPPCQYIDQRAADLAFMCHTDTVPYSPNWTGATEPRVADGQLHGCGACDVKGFLACLLTSIATVDTSKLMGGLRLVLTADEEIGCIGASRLIGSESFRPKRVVVGEPTSLHPVRAGKGYCLAQITIFGQEAHSALPHKGKSAIYGAARVITAIEEYAAKLAKTQHDFFSPSFTTLNIGIIQGGTAKNIIPRQCSFQLEWRPIPGRSIDTDVVAAITGILDELQRADPDFDFELEVLREQGGFETGADCHLVRMIERLSGRSATSISFGSEASLFAGVAEEVVVFGPGDMQTAHSSRECVPLIELQESVAILKSLMSVEN